jgi:phenylacetate-coenzyme A ligase PaaK-like adenylate-forming protein
MPNYYDLDPTEQRKASAQRLFHYLREYVQPYHPYLRKLYREQKIDLAKLKTPDDIRRLPIIDKHHLRENPQLFILQPTFPGVPSPAGFETATIARAKLLRYMYQAARNRPRDYSQQVRRESFREQVRHRALTEWLPIHFHVSTGSTGNPTPAVYTLYDVKQVIGQMAPLMIVPKKRDPDDCYFDWGERAMNIFPGAPHLAFFAPVLAKATVGTSSFDTFGGSVIPTDRQISIFAQGGFSSLTAVPSYLVHWLRRAKALQQEGAIGKLDAFKRVAVGAEPMSESLREHIRELALGLGAHPRFKIYQTLGMTEMKWFAMECGEGSGIHLNPRFYYWELLHPETREPVKEGEPGVLVFSHIGWRGTVLARYWTGDLIKQGFRWDRCQHCGYTFPRVYPPICRAEKDFTKIKGTRVDLSNLIESIRDTPGVRHFQVSIESENGVEQFARDVLSVHLIAEQGRDPRAVEEQLCHRVKYYTEVTPDRVVFEENEPEFEKRLFAKNGIKAEYVVERRKEHI